MSAPAIKTIDLHFRIGGKPILSGVNFEVHPGEAVSIMGSSGSGKTTLLRCISGLIQPTSGEIWVEGIEISRLSERDKLQIRRKLGIVFQYAALFDYLTVYENVAFGVERLSKPAKGKIAQIVQERLAWVGLEGTESLYPSELSGGMRKRVGLARALATDPDIVLFDEPTSGLDPVTGFQIDSLIARLKRELGLTAVVVSHDVASVMRVSDRVAMLSDGVVAAEGTPQEIHSSDHPQVRSFMQAASANVL